MKSKNLLTQITDLESALHNFSFEELSTAEAARLKRSFDLFKNELEAKIWGFNPIVEENSKPAEEQDVASTKNEKEESSLIAKVSHEIRTPLNGIIGFADLLIEGKLDESQKEQVNAILKASNSLMEIINELLEYSKLEAGREEFKKVPFNFHNLIREVSYLCETLIVDKKIAFEVKIDPEIPQFLLGDPSKLSQVLLNLLGNAIKFADEGKVILDAKLKTTNVNRVGIEFYISDTGIGISEEDLLHIFDAFKRARQHTFSKYGGTGLGLSIVKQIVNRLGGDITVESKVNKGTTFHMQLEYEVGKEEKTKMKKSSNASPADVEALTVLVFEDNPLNQWLIKKRLKEWGCTFFVTEHAETGLKILEEENIHLVLMDLHMPVMDGYEITQMIRASDHPRISKVPVIALTADFSVNDKEKAASKGINDYILKPYTPEELMEKLIQYGFSNEQENALQKKNADLGEVQKKLEAGMSIDLSGMLEDCMGEVDMLEELLNLFKGNVLEFIGKARMHLKNKDYEQLQFVAHKLKSGLAMVQAANLLILVQQIQEHCKTDKNHDQMQYLYEQFIKEYPMVEFALDKEMTRLKKENK
ncbi:ATP-binding protein [Muriicola soli]|uniref:ATP-binding protein n=1 Tax=Muriicola soli TaxID=2507538 RepID=UPI0013EE306F|nr:ATP-binding protein [Muriicola soli]